MAGYLRSRALDILLVRRYATTSSKIMQLFRMKGYSILEMNKAPVNAFDKAFLVDFQNALEEVKKASTRGLLITSGLQSTFSAGLDFSELYQRKSSDIEMFWSKCQSLWMDLYSFPLPVVAAINGHCLAGGCILLSCCDYRIATRGNYKIGLPAARLGLVAPKWFLLSLTAVMGQRQTELMASQAKVMDPSQAHQSGLVDELCDVEELEDKAISVLEKFSEVDGEAQTAMKLQLREDLLNSMKEQREEDLKKFVNWTLKERTQNILSRVYDKGVK